MQRLEGDDIWDCEGIAWIVIPTNIGYKRWPQKKVQPACHVGPNVMGRGLAQDAASKYPWLPPLYGEFCWLHGPDTPVTYDMCSRTVLFPTKPMNTNEPWMSWKGKADLERIRTSARQLNNLILPRKEALSQIHVPQDKPYCGSFCRVR